MDCDLFVLGDKAKIFVEYEGISQEKESVPDFQIAKSDHLSGLYFAKNDKSSGKFRQIKLGPFWKEVFSAMVRKLYVFGSEKEFPLVQKKLQNHLPANQGMNCCKTIWLERVIKEVKVYFIRNCYPEKNAKSSKYTSTQFTGC